MSKDRVFENPLVAAVVARAENDYRNARRRLRKNPSDYQAQKLLKDCVWFFKSDWFRTVTSAPGEPILKKLEEEMNG